jgi:hypothetical protein
MFWDLDSIHLFFFTWLGKSKRNKAKKNYENYKIMSATLGQERVLSGCHNSPTGHAQFCVTNITVFIIRFQRSG